MRRALAGLLVLALLALGSLPALGKGGEAQPPPGAPPPAADPLVVHEWGTFTSVQGADGIGLEGLQHEEEGLPDFVYSRVKVRDCPLRDKGYKGLEVPATHVTQKMETPVLYFHTKTPRRVRVRVDFVKGLISQWYPVSDLLGPPEGPRDAGPLDVSKVERSFLQWDVDLVPDPKDLGVEIRAVERDDPWGFARHVDAARVRTAPRKTPERSGPVEAEHFLFYRGLGSFSLPVEAQAGGKVDWVSFVNRGAHAVRCVVGVEVGENAKTGRWGWRLDVAPGAIAANLLGDRKPVEWSGDGDGGVEDLKRFVQKILMDQGMNSDEARAMVATWTRSWFTTEGTRVFYVVPRALVDELLPLQIDPAPQRVERVLVGRIECVTPRTLAEVEAALRTLATVDPRTSPEEGQKVKAAEARLRRLGRFEEAHLRRVIATTKDGAVREKAESLLPK